MESGLLCFTVLAACPGASPGVALADETKPLRTRGAPAHLC